MNNAIFTGLLVLFGLLATPAFAQLRPGAASIITTQDQQANVEADNRLEGQTFSTGNALDSVDWGVPEWLSEPAPGSEEGASEESDESIVERRAREVTREANQRWYERRVRADVPLDERAYPEAANWFTPEGEPVPEHWPWWLW